MKTSAEIVAELEKQLNPCACGCGQMEKLDYTIENGVVSFATAYTDWHVRKPGVYSKGNYARILKVSGALAAAIG